MGARSPYPTESAPPHVKRQESMVTDEVSEQMNGSGRAFVVMPDANFDEAAEVEHVSHCEHVRPAALERVLIRLRVFEMKLTGVTEFAEQNDEDVGVGPGARHVARFHRNSIRFRFNNSPSLYQHMR